MSKKVEEINPTQKYPIIWKRTGCLAGECRDVRTSHRWSIPCGSPAGLMTECYDCHKTRIVHTEVDESIWLNLPTQGTEWTRKRLEELKCQKKN